MLSNKNVRQGDPNPPPHILWHARACTYVHARARIAVPMQAALSTQKCSSGQTVSYPCACWVQARKVHGVFWWRRRWEGGTGQREGGREEDGHMAPIWAAAACSDLHPLNRKCRSELPHWGD